MTEYRVKLRVDSNYGLQTQFVDVEAVSPADAVRWALRTHQNAISAQCLGTSADCLARGEQALSEGKHA